MAQLQSPVSTLLCCATSIFRGQTFAHVNRTSSVTDLYHLSVVVLMMTSCIPWNQASSFTFHVVRGTHIMHAVGGDPAEGRCCRDYSHDYSPSALETGVIAPDQSPFVTYRGRFGIRFRVQPSGLIWCNRCRRSTFNLLSLLELDIWPSCS